MTLRHSLPMLSLAAAALLAVAVPANAQQKRERDRGGESAERGMDRGSRGGRQDTLSDSIRRVERSTRGQVLRAERMQSDGRDVNRIKVVDDSGRVRVYLDDPRQRPSRSTRGDDD
ncbi:hypothetical protein [Luteimonas vadosa]|uniref:PepSY domain-containing protein n=1 Tax=Luteimonas vadosa TaxID=1165507 RepID=A0ABP9DT29_9GAMM